MRKGFAVLLVLILVIFAGCSEDSSDAVQTPGSNPAPAETEAEKQPESSEIVSAFSGIASEEYISVSAGAGTTLVSIFEPELGEKMLSAYSEGLEPEDWAGIQQRIVDIASTIEPINGASNVSVSLKDAKDGTIYLTVINDKVSYDAFHVEDVSSNDPTITLDEFNQITNGMTYQEVVDIVGGPGELLSETDLGMGSEYASAMYMWEGEGSIGANANVMFQGGAVVSKSQLGLE